MKQDKSFIDHEFLLEIVNHIPDAIVLLDAEMNVKFNNQLFEDLFQHQNEIDFNEILGNKIGCKEFHSGSSADEMKINCSNCKLKNSVKEAFLTKKLQKPDTIVLQTITDNDKPLKLIQYQSVFLKVKNADFVLLKINDLTELGEKTLGLISKI